MAEQSPGVASDANVPGGMGTHGPDGAERAAVALAQELREIAAELCQREVSEAEAAAALRHARQLRDCLRGERRARWYEHGGIASQIAPGAKTAFGDLSPLRGLLNPVAPPLRFETVERSESPRIIATARLSRAYEGPPHGVHGGFVAAMFDEVLGAVMGLAPPPGVTATLEVRYRHVTPVEETLRFEAWIDDQRERRLTARATCHAGETLTADARAMFVRVDFDEVARRMASRRGA